MLFRIILSLTLAIATNISSAANFQNSTGLANPKKIQTFNIPTLPNGTPAGQLFADLSFSSNLRISSQFDGQYGSTGQALINFYPCCSAASYIDFSQPISAVGFLFATNLGTSRFTAFFHGTQVESFTALTSFSPNQYFGFSNIQFDRLKIEAGGITRAFVLDNLQTSPVPEPASYAMLGLGLAALMFLRKRREKSSGALKCQLQNL